jgi:L-alanine-DL-glutamate epimerase-like enolase superfamily enzyme
LKITHIDVHTCSVPPTPTALYRIDKTRPLQEQIDADTRPKYIAEVHTDEGLVGLGESHRGIDPALVREALEPLIGLDPLKLNLRALPVPQSIAYDVGEIAIYDIVGKASGLSVSQLLGGPFREWVGAHYWMGKRTPEESAEIAVEGKEKGFTGVKIKCGNDAPEHESVARVRAIRDAVGDDFELELDANGGFSKRDDLEELCRQLYELGVLRLEDPYPRVDPKPFAALRQRIPLPLAYHALTLGQVLEAVRIDAAQAMNVGCGSLSLFVRMADLADAAGIPTWHGSAQELGIRDAAYVHSIAAAPGCTLSSDILHHLWEDDLIETPLELKNGQVRVPSGPGLGVELDRDAVARYTVDSFSLR